jgi:hypothetical protein
MGWLSEAFWGIRYGLDTAFTRVAAATEWLFGVLVVVCLCWFVLERIIVWLA